MNNKPPLQVSSYNLPSPPSPPMCFPSPKNNKRDNVGLCGCQRAPKSHCISAFGKYTERTFHLSNSNNFETVTSKRE